MKKNDMINEYHLVGYTGAGKTQYLLEGYKRLRQGIGTGHGTLSVQVDGRLSDLCSDYNERKEVVATSEDIIRYTITFTLDGRRIASVVLADMRGGYIIQNGAGLGDRIHGDAKGIVAVYSCEPLAKDVLLEYRSLDSVRKELLDRESEYTPTVESIVKQTWESCEGLRVMTLFSKSDVLFGPVDGPCDLRRHVCEQFVEGYPFGTKVFSSSRPDYTYLYSMAVWYWILLGELEGGSRLANAGLKRFLRTNLENLAYHGSD